MRRLIRAGKREPEIISLARRIVNRVPAKNFPAEVDALYEYVSDNMRYTKDMTDAEAISPVWHLLDDMREHGNGFGDCDDFVVLFCALAEAVGHKTKIIAVGQIPGTYSHVYAETLVGRRWVPVDCTMQYGVGWRPPGMMQTMEISNGS